MTKPTRREFLIESAKLTGGALAALTLGSGVFSPKMGQAAKTKFLESICGPSNASDRKVLVTYASRCGSTGGVAETIGRVLCEKGISVEVRLVKNVTDMAPYRAVVIGSAIRSSKWLPEAIEFVEANCGILSQMPVAYFLTCLALSKPTEANRQKAATFLDPLKETVPQVRPIDVGLFAGVLDYSKLSWPMRLVMKRKMKSKWVSEGDYRDWRAIRAWAAGVRSAL